MISRQQWGLSIPLSITPPATEELETTIATSPLSHLCDAAGVEPSEQITPHIALVQKGKDDIAAQPLPHLVSMGLQSPLTCDTAIQGDTKRLLLSPHYSRAWQSRIRSAPAPRPRSPSIQPAFCRSASTKRMWDRTRRNFSIPKGFLFIQATDLSVPPFEAHSPQAASLTTAQ